MLKALDLDTRIEDKLARSGMTTAMLADPAWRMKMLDGQSVPTQDLARTLIADGFAGLLIRSFAKGATALCFNIVLWAWTGNSGSLQVVDDEDRLSRM